MSDGDEAVHGWTDGVTTVAAVREALAAFNREREWEQFHAPKDLAVCVAVEASELLAEYLWRQDAQSLEAVQDEIADVLIATLNLAAKLDIDALAAVDRKLAKNALKYPVALARGRADKYDKLRDLAEEEQ